MTSHKFMYGLAVIAISLSAGIFTPTQSQAAVDDSFTIGDLTYLVLTEDDTTGTVSIVGCNAEATAVIIHSSVVNDGKTYTVTTIGSRAFSSTYYLQGIKIPNSVTSIAAFAFIGCYNLENLTIPASVTSFGYVPFTNCPRLACVYYEGITPEVFQSSSRRKSYDGAFAALTSYYRAENKDSWEPLIDENNKWEERRIECIDKPVSGTKGIAYEYLEDGTAVVLGIGTASETDIIIPVTVENPNDGKTYIVRSIGNSAFQGTGITSLTMGSSIEMIGDNAFQSCTGLTKAMIGSCVRSMGENVFQDCCNLMEVYYDGYIPDIKGEIYTNTPQELISYYNKAEKIFWENATILGSWQNRKALCITETIPGTKELGFDHFTEEGTVAVFGKHLTLEKVVIPPTFLMGRRLFTVTTIMKQAFGASTFTSIEIPDTITTIEQFAFQSCNNLTSITIPNSVTSLESNAFSGCNSLTGVYYQGDVPIIYFGTNQSSNLLLYGSSPNSLISYYPEGNATWEAVIENGKWRGRGIATWNPTPTTAKLTYSLDNGILTLSFTGTLEESDDTVNWIPVQEAITPYVVDINKEKKFYRAVQ
ncbi:MAG: leucine-rich repeat domain-containing protein [Verrucomicrobia bacterium]|nr:leucine-rich repeat domain-containing protein [Verrucomicrobiota bacterium]